MSTFYNVNNFTKNWILPDTSALLRRPRLIEDLVSKFDRVIICRTVVSELNNIKDRADHRVNQNAWLVMIGITTHLESGKGKVVLEEEVSKRKLNDDRILDIASSQANNNPDVHLTVLSDDVYFSLQSKNMPNLSFITLSEYGGQIFSEDENFDIRKTESFLNNIKTKKFESIKKLNLYGINLNYIDPITGYTPLIQAIRNRDIRTIDYLTSLKGIDLNKRDSSKYELPPISHAVQINNETIINILIDKGCDFDLGSTGVNRGNTPIMIASWSGFTDVVKILLKEGACLNQQDTNGYTPLMKACIRGHYEVINILINDTDANIRSRDGKTAREYVSKKDIFQIFNGESEIHGGNYND